MRSQLNRAHSVLVGATLSRQPLPNQAMIRRKTNVSRRRHKLPGERINYGTLAYETIRK